MCVPASGEVKEAGVGTDCCCEGEVVMRLWTGQQEFKVMPFAKVLPMMGKNASNISAELHSSDLVHVLVLISCSSNPFLLVIWFCTLDSLLTVPEKIIQSYQGL